MAIAISGVDYLWRYAMLRYMVKNTDEKPLTIKDVHEALIPAIQEVFTTRRDLERYLIRQERRLYTIVLEALKEHELLASNQPEEIDELELQ